MSANSETHNRTPTIRARPRRAWHYHGWYAGCAQEYSILQHPTVVVAHHSLRMSRAGVCKLFGSGGMSDWGCAPRRYLHGIPISMLPTITILKPQPICFGMNYGASAGRRVGGHVFAEGDANFT
jgi:hypothetical protein